MTGASKYKHFAYLLHYIDAQKYATEINTNLDMLIICKTVLSISWLELISLFDFHCFSRNKLPLFRMHLDIVTQYG